METRRVDREIGVVMVPFCMMSGLARIGCFALGLAFSIQGQVPENLVLDGVPEPSRELREQVAPYLEFRAATFQDWHPRRRDVLAILRAAEVPQLYRVRQPLGPLERLTSGADRISGGAWAPHDGSAVVFSRDRGGDECFQLYRWDASSGREALLTDGRSRNTFARWSASGRRLAYVSTRRNGRDTDLFVMDPRRPETDRRVAELPGGGWAVLDWAPDETGLLIVDYRSVTESALHGVEVEAGRIRRIAPGVGERISYTEGRVLPGGGSALVISDRDSEHRHLARIDLRTGREAPFGPEYGWSVEEFDLSPDGTTVAALTNEDGVSVLHLLEVGTGRELRAPRLPVGVASGLRWHRGRREVGFTLKTARSPGEVWSVDTRVNGLTRWTESETPGGASFRGLEPERIRVRSFDGLAVSGWLYRPEPRRFPGPRPVVVNLHGGPEGQARPECLRAWGFLVQELGIALLYPNVRGSEGYGKTFLGLDNGVRREDAVKDVGAFLDWIGGDARLDGGRVAVYGASYGGYLVLASLIHFGERLRCGVDVVGITHFRTFLENTDESRRDLRRVEYGDERDPGMGAFLDRISPINQAERIWKPVLVVQGKNDPRVPAAQSERLVKAIRSAGSTVGYLLANDEGHGFVRRQNAEFLFLAVVQFLEQHLLQDAGAGG